MKKTLTFLLAILASSLMFAQISYAQGMDLPDDTRVHKTLSPSAKASLQERMAMRRNAEAGTRGGLSFYWVGFVDAVENAGSLPELNVFLMWEDSTVRIEDSAEGDFYWFQHGYEQIYDPNSMLINDTYITDNTDVEFGSGKKYEVDSMEFYFLYERVSAPSIVDTLRVYVFSQGNMLNGTFTDGTAFTTGRFSAANFGPQGSIIKEFEILLTEADTATAFINFRTLGLDNLTLNQDRKLGVAWHFISGQSYSTGDILFSNDLLGPVGLNNFDLVTFEEDAGVEPTSPIIDAPAFNMGGIIPSSVLYGIDALGWNGLYVTSLAYTAPMNDEHALVYFQTAPIGAHFVAGTTGTPCEIQFTNLSNVPNQTDYFWEFGDGSISLDENPVYTYMMNGTYTVSFDVEDDAGTNFGKEGAVVVTNCATGLEGIEGLVNFDVFPNPASEFINIDLELEQNQGLELSIIDIQGQVVFNERIGQTNYYRNALDISDLASGMYVVRLQNDSRVATRNFVVR